MKNILIVEDELIIAKDLERILRNQNWNVSGICTHAAEAFRKIGTLSPDLVLIDIILKGRKEGIEIGRFLATSTEIPFIYVTSFTDRTTIDEVTSTTPAGYVVKPFRTADVVTAVEVAFAANNKRKKASSTREAIPLEEVPIKIRRVAEYIHENFDKRLKIDFLAGMTPWNPHHFIRNFKKYLGDTPYQYILKYKMGKAKILLEKTKMPISKIASELGFSNHSSFSTAFLKIEKRTAESYRRTFQ